MLPGVFQAKKKDGSIYFRSTLTYHGRHISLGSFETEQDAHTAYLQAKHILENPDVTISNVIFQDYVPNHEKLVTLLNFRDNGIYIKNPIYLFRSYFNYYLTPDEIYKFDIDDLFYFSGHKLLKRGGRLYVNDYGMQVTVMSRYGIRNFASAGKDYLFANQDPYDLRYENIININPFHGVRQRSRNGMVCYDVYIHIKGDYHIGAYQKLQEAAVAYNKAVDLAHQYGVTKNFPTNYLAELSSAEYGQAYLDVEIPVKYLKYLKKICGYYSQPSEHPAVQVAAKLIQE